MKTLALSDTPQARWERRQPRGGALFVALVFVMIATAVMLAVSSATFNNATRTTEYISRENAYYAARGLNDLMLSDLNDGHHNSGVADLRAYLNAGFTWTPVAAGDDPIADGLRITKADGTVSTSIAVSRANVTKWKNLVLGPMQPARVRLYRRDRSSPDNYVKYTDLLIVTEVQNNQFDPDVLQAALANPANYPNVKVGDGAAWFASMATSQDPPIYAGFDYAVLTKNLTCTCCHMRVRDLYRSKNSDTNKYNSFGRVKVGTTQFLACRPSSAYTVIEGTLYHRGKLEDESSGAAITAATFQGSTVQCVKFNSTTPPTIYQNTTSGATTVQSFANNSSGTVDAVTGAGNTAPTNARGNLYLNYPLDPNKQTDGALPTSDFPAPFADVAQPLPNNPSKIVPNSKVDPAEVLAKKLQFDGEANAGASITGGVCLKGITQANPYTATALPTTGLPADLTNGYVGNVVLTGTTTNPIHLNGSVVIDGDVMISGYVEGTGQIYATGNVYVPGDVMYNNKKDANNKEIFGISPNDESNLMGLVAGKNIIVGDYLSSITHWNSSKPDFFKPDLDGTGGKAGTPEPAKKIAYVKNTSVTPKTQSGTQNPYTDLNGAVSTTNLAGTTINGVNAANFVVEQLAVFNREEFTKTLPKVPTANPTVASNYTSGIANPFYDDKHVPRYYTFYPDNYNPYNDATGNPTKANPISLFVNSGTPWSTSKYRWNTSGDPHCYGWLSELADMPAAAQSSLVNDANKISIHPPWISPDTMLKLLSDVESKRTSGTARRLDGLLYTNNAIFAVERKQAQYYNPSSDTWSKVASKSGGTMTVNGALIAPDLGVLVTGTQQTSGQNDAFCVNYDGRVRSFLPITATDSGQWGDFKRAGVSHGLGLLR